MLSGFELHPRWVPLIGDVYQLVRIQFIHRYAIAYHDASKT